MDISLFQQKVAIVNKNLFVSWLSLFSSFGTLICCALPSLFIALGMGAAFAGLIGAVPQIIWVSEHKGLVFGLSGVLIAGSLFWLYAVRNEPCPVDPEKARACKVARKWSVRISLASVVFWVLGFIFAFILG